MRTRNDLLGEIERIWIKLGRQPTSTDIKNRISIYTLNTFSRRFGGWRGALEAFIEYIDVDNQSNEPTKSIDVKTETQVTEYQSNKVITNASQDSLHETQSDVNYRLRFKVMQRDNFKCCVCGASPAKDPAVELHIDILFRGQRAEKQQ